MRQRCRSCRDIMSSSYCDLKSPRFWQALLAEFLGTMVLVLVGCGTCLGKDWESYAPSVVQISLSFGLSVATVVWCICHVSGGHVNPAVTIAMLTTRKISILRAFAYIVAQCVGALAGASILAGLTPKDVQGSLGMTTINSALSVEQGFGVEFIVTFILVLTIFASCDGRRNDLNGSAPLSIGIAVSICHLFAIKYTGASMNPARSLGPAIISRLITTEHWVYWCGPILGGMVAGLLYDLVFAADASLTKARNFVLSTFDKQEDYQVQPQIDLDEKQLSEGMRKSMEAEVAV